jgi:drug/metabolite transporter (DMT)-like permease
VSAERDSSAQPSGELSFSAAAQMTAINLLWGASSVASANALDAFGPFTLAALRFLPAGLILLAVARRERRFPSVPRSDWLSFLLLGVFGIFLTYPLFYAGMKTTTSSDASLVLASEPLMIALAARAFLGERLSGRQWLGMLVGLAGVYLIAGQAAGNRIALLGLCCESFVSVVAKRLTTRYSGLFVVAIEMLIGSALLLPFAINEITQHTPMPDAPALAGYFYLTLVSSTFCYGLWFRAMERYPVSAMGVFILMQPLAGPFYGWLLRGEVLKSGSALGGGLVLVGIAMTTLKFTTRYIRDTERNSQD